VRGAHEREIPRHLDGLGKLVLSAVGREGAVRHAPDEELLITCPDELALDARAAALGD